MGSVTEFAFLLKNPEFKFSILPIIKIFSNFLIHVIFILILVIAVIAKGFTPTIYWLQLAYYIFSGSILILGLSWIFSSIQPFVKDTGRIVGIFLQIGIWATPIFWPYKQVPQKYAYILDLNPVYYLVRGYRDSLLEGKWFWNYPAESLIFWGTSIVFLFLGMTIYLKLRPHFAEVI